MGFFHWDIRSGQRPLLLLRKNGVLELECEKWGQDSEEWVEFRLLVFLSLYRNESE